MDATIGAAAQRPTSRGNEYHSNRIAFGSRYPSVRSVPIGLYDWCVTRDWSANAASIWQLNVSVIPRASLSPFVSRF